MTQKFDITLYGATSFVGKIAAAYLLERYGAENSEFSWCIAARSKQKLQQLVSELGGEADKVPQLVADSMTASDMQALCDASSVIISTVGPYAHYGEQLIKACSESGTHYCDLTGEPLWMADMIGKYENSARESGARIVHCCGFDSIPSDMGTYFLQKHAIEKYGETCETVETGLKAAKGTFSGGTVASLINAVKEAVSDKSIRRKAANPYLLCPQEHGFSARQRTESYYYSDALKAWCAPFVMAAINTKVVHRSNALQQNKYGQSFRYSEYTMTGNGSAGRMRAMGMTGGMAGFMTMLAISPTRKLLEKFALPKPGEGPSPEIQRSGYFDLRIAGTTSNGQVVTAKVTGDRDPGYGSTAKMLSESALCLLDLHRNNSAQENSAPTGFWTPSSLLGDQLLTRLENNAGLSFSIL